MSITVVQPRGTTGLVRAGSATRSAELCVRDPGDDPCYCGEPGDVPDSTALGVTAAAIIEIDRHPLVLRVGAALGILTIVRSLAWARLASFWDSGLFLPQPTLETDIWHTPSGDQPVHFWREPLSALCTAATDAGFLIEKVIEPVPTETMRDRYPEDYEKLSREPGFLILRLLRPAGPPPSSPAQRS
jgi:hypothetical protein